MSDLSRQFQVLGVSHHDSPLDIREKLSFHESTSKRFLQNLKEVCGITEAMLVSTCNRTEIYFSGTVDQQQEVQKLLCLEKNLEVDSVKEFFRTFNGDEAVTHLFRVSLGLDAKVLGDIQIINQVKNAYQWSADEGMAGPYLHRLMHTIFFANKRVTQETSFRDGAGSVASVAVSLIKSQLEVVNDPRILLIGTGEIGQNVLENLGDDFTDVTIINRTRDRAEKLAEEQGYRVADIDKLEAEVNKADVVISAANAGQLLIERKNIQPSLTPKLLIDLSVPRSIDIQAEEVQGVLLYNVDQIEERSSQVLKERQKAKAEVEEIVVENINEFKSWSEEMTVSPTIQLLKERLELIRQEEISRHLKNLSEKELELLNTVTKNMIQKVIKLPVLELKAACKRGDADSLVETLHDIFNLEKSTEKKV